MPGDNKTLSDVLLYTLTEITSTIDQEGARYVDVCVCLVSYSSVILFYFVHLTLVHTQLFRLTKNRYVNYIWTDS